ncbi:MAG: hypothetical protein R3A80_02290 [Bdellovibrionota bacterium]
MLNNKMSARLFICGAFFLWLAFYFFEDSDSYAIKSSDEEITNPFKTHVDTTNKFLLASNDVDGISLPPDMGRQQLKFMLKAGTGLGELGISTTNGKIGPGLIKRIRNGYMIADTFNNRIIKLNDEGDIKQTLSFPKSSLIQGAAENSKGEVGVIRREYRKLKMDLFDESGNIIHTQPLNIKDEEILYNVGTFRTFYSNDELYINNGDKTLRVSENGETKEVPGIPMENSPGLYVATRMGPNERYIVDIKDDSYKAVKSFYAQGKYDSLKSVYTDKKNQIHVEFEQVIESFSLETQENVATKSTIIETYDQNGKFLQDNIIESNVDVEIDQNVDIDEEGNLNNLVFQGDSFKVYELII